MGDFIFDNLGKIILVILILLIIGCFLIAEGNVRCRENLIGFQKGDIEAFEDIYNVTACQIMSSHSLQNKLSDFVNGKEVDLPIGSDSTHTTVFIPMNMN